MQTINTLLLMIIPLVVAGVLHMVVVNRDYFSSLKQPINIQQFGKNKTYRGFIIMPLAAAFTAALLMPLIKPSLFIFTPSAASGFYIGLILAISYLLFELPNSFLKRRLGIPPGGHPQKYRRFFYWADQLDSAIGVMLGAFIILHLPLAFCFLACAIHPLIAITVKKCLHTFRLKETAY